MDNGTAPAFISRRRLHAILRAGFAFLWLLPIAACASTDAPPAVPGSATDRSCTRLEAADGAAKMWIREGILAVPRPAVESCTRGNPIGCAAVPIAAATAVLFAPMVPVVGFFASEADARRFCR